jgi:DNA-binding XRE family transcriptional regulator
MEATMSNDWFFERLPLRPSPYDGECLSGYILRLAEVNGYKILWDLVGDLFPRWKAPQQIGLLKWEYPLDNWGRMPLRTGLTSVELNRLTVLSWVEKFRSPLDTNSNCSGPGNALHGILNPNLRVCSPCLQSQPYLRLIWRLLPVTVCLEHGCLLEERCSACGTLLTPVSQDHRHLRCSNCDTDLRSLSVVMAPQGMLDVQKRSQDGFRFLLDPETTICRTDEGFGCNPVHVLGLKFRYIRHLAKVSTKTMAKKADLTTAALKAIEEGIQVTFPQYLTYLETIQMSWKEFALLDVPDVFLQGLKSPRHPSLRVCPDPKCPSHEMPLSSNVIMLRDLPEQNFARFRCKICGKRFTRSYDGSLRARPSCPSLRTGEKHNLMEPQAEILSLIEMGLRGEFNRKIAQSLGWGEKTVRIYWIALGLEDQVHRAQAQRRAANKLEQHARLGSQIQAILELLLQENRCLTLQEVHQALGTNCFYMQRYTDHANYLRQVIQQHNVRIKQQQDDAVSSQISRSIASLACVDHQVFVDEIVGQAGLSYTRFRKKYPALHLVVHRAIQEHRSRIKELQLKNQIRQVDEAAHHLVEKGVRLNYKAILREAGLSPHAVISAPIRDALARWVSNFAPRD